MKTPIYKIIFGKDLEYLEDELDEDIWPDKYEKTTSFKHKYVAGEFVTDDIDIFWTMMLNLRRDPPAMWYWVVEVKTNKTLISGAIDYDDPERLAKTIGAPDWILGIIG